MSRDANDILKARGAAGLRIAFDHALKMNGHSQNGHTSPAVSICAANRLYPRAYTLALGGSVVARGTPHAGWRPWHGQDNHWLISTAATVSAGVRWPDDTTCEAGDVLIWSGEDGIADTLVPRLLVAGGNPKRVHFIDGVTEHGRASALRSGQPICRRLSQKRKGCQTSS